MSFASGVDPHGLVEPLPFHGNHEIVADAREHHILDLARGSWR